MSAPPRSSPDAAAVGLSYRSQQYHEDGARIEAAFRRYIHRADPKQKEDSYEIIVCHANVIRYFVCRCVWLVSLRAWRRPEQPPNCVLVITMCLLNQICECSQC